MSFLKKINRFFSINVKPLAMSKEEQENLLNKFSAPNSLIERSYYQYKIQFDLLNVKKRMLNNLASFFGIFFLIIKSVRFFTNKAIQEESDLAIFPYKNLKYENIIPYELDSLYNIKEVNFNCGFKLSVKDFSLIFKIFIKYPFDTYFQLKCLQKLFFYRYLIDVFSPKAIICCAEYSFSSSVLTLLCRKSKVKHINTMHGEKLFYVRDSFFEFDKFYVWDNHYINLFVKLRAEEKQFKVGEFPFMKSSVKDNIKYNYTYYLADENDEQLRNIRTSLESLQLIDKVCIRYHPRYSSKNKINDFFGSFVIQDPYAVTLEESFAYTKCIISLYSSVLTQGYFLEKTIIIDDVTHNKEKYENLKESGLFILHKKHLKLSNIIESHN